MSAGPEILAFLALPYVVLIVTAPIWAPLVWIDEARRRRRDARRSM